MGYLKKLFNDEESNLNEKYAEKKDCDNCDLLTEVVWCENEAICKECKNFNKWRKIVKISDGNKL
jgi:hypothetical protein